MKKILALILCAVLICAAPVVAMATEESPSEEVETPTTEEVTTEGENTEPEKTFTESIVEYVQSHFEEISVIGTLLLTIFYEIRKHSKLNGSIGILNNNAVTVAEKSADAINAALDKVEAISKQVEGYHKAFDSLIEEIRISDAEKTALKDALVKVESYLNTSKLANLEFADELANLLCLANIPNAKKEEFFSRHRAAVDAIAVAEHPEVNTDDGQEA